METVGYRNLTVTEGYFCFWGHVQTIDNPSLANRLYFDVPNRTFNGKDGIFAGRVTSNTKADAKNQW